MPSLCIYLFGAPRLERDGEVIHLPRQKSVALLAYLATTGQAHSRDALATLFWPEFNQSTARANLRRELSRLKKALGNDPFEIHGEQVGLKQEVGVWLDVEVFQRRLAEARRQIAGRSDPTRPEDLSAGIEAISEAAGLYTGDFMAGFSLPDSSEFDEWQFFQSESLRRFLEEALQQLVRWEISQGEYERAIEYARRWLALDSLSEPAHRQLMQLYDWAGQHGAALRQYQECVRILSKEVGVEPDGVTTALYETIRTRQLPPPEADTQRGDRAHMSPGNLPAQSTPFIGREKEQSYLRKLLVEDPYSRLLTIIGPGGVGKTRLALQAASAAQPAFRDGVYFIPLASLASADYILSMLAEQLRFRFIEAAEHKQQLFDYLRQKQMLLLMDNVEHLLPGAALIVEVLQAAPGVKILVTSRVRLNLSDEVAITLSGMEYPDWAKGMPLSGDLSEYEAIKLFVQSARRVNPDFELQPGNLELAARLCSLVEGMPLAIILATGWLELLSLEEICEEMTRSLDFLESSAQDLPERQRSLRAVFNSSWSLLNEQERDILERLIVFQGGFTRQAASAVAGASPAALLALLHKAWLQRGGEGRFQIPELQRQYASEMLQANPDAWLQTRDEHGAYYAEKLEMLAKEMQGANFTQAYAEVATEFENIRTAWHWLVERKQFDALVYRLLPALYRYCEMHAKSNELMQWIGMALEAIEGSSDGLSDPLYLTILLTAQASFYRKGDSVRLDRYDILLPPAYEDNIHRVGSLVVSFEKLRAMGLWGSLFSYLYGRFIEGEKGRQYLQQLIAYFREEGLSWELAITLQFAGCLDLVISLNSAQNENYLNEAGQYLTEALAIFQRLGDEREYSHTLLWLGDYYNRQHRLEEAVSAWQAAQAKFDEIGDVIVSIHWLLGDLIFHSGDYEAAFQYYSEIIKKCIEMGHKRTAAYGLSRESIEALRYSGIEHARRTREQSLQLSQEVQDRFGEAWSVWEMGEILRVEGDYNAARTWYERARGMFEEVKEINGVIFYHRGMGDIAHTQGDYSEAYRQFQLSLEYARRVNYKWGVAYALAGLGRAATGLGEYDAARSHLSEGLRTAEATGDHGLALFVLASWAHLYAATGESELAAETGGLVSRHFASWRETKAQIASLLTSINDLSSQHWIGAQSRGRQAEVWEVVDRYKLSGS